MRVARLSVLAGVAAVALGAAALGADVRISSINGKTLTPFAPAGAAGVIFFVATDCPISNSYAPEIQRLCRDYASRGVACSLMYEDVDTDATPELLDDAVRKHLVEFRYRDIDAAVDRSRLVATAAQATVTPQAVIVDRSGAIRYRGRIDNFYAALGKPRQQVTARDLRDALDAILAGRSVARRETEALGCFIVDPAHVRK